MERLAGMAKIRVRTNVGKNSRLPRMDVPLGGTLCTTRRQCREDDCAWL